MQYTTQGGETLNVIAGRFLIPQIPAEALGRYNNIIPTYTTDPAEIATVTALPIAQGVVINIPDGWVAATSAPFTALSFNFAAMPPLTKFALAVSILALIRMVTLPNR